MSFTFRAPSLGGVGGLMLSREAATAHLTRPDAAGGRLLGGKSSIVPRAGDTAGEHWPLVGRAVELERFGRLLRSGAGSIVLAGPVGVGRSPWR